MILLSILGRNLRCRSSYQLIYGTVRNFKFSIFLFCIGKCGVSGQGWNQEFSDGGLTLPTGGLKYGFQGTINAKISEKLAFHLPTKGYSPLSFPWCHPCSENFLSQSEGCLLCRKYVTHFPRSLSLTASMI